MRRIKEVIVVEGRYDKNTLSQIVDATILETEGFGIFNDRQKQKLLRELAKKQGLIILTDSDGAGFVIRNYIRSCVDPSYVKHAYIPTRQGKERRKRRASKEGKLGVEGMSPDILLDALTRAGASFDEKSDPEVQREQITKLDLYRAGFSGRIGSQAARSSLLQKLDLPEHISSNVLLEILNALMSREEFLEEYFLVSPKE